MAELPVFSELEWDSHISHWSILEQSEGMLKLEKGAVIDSLMRNHGEKSVADFAWEVGEGSPKTLWEYARVYRRLVSMGDSARADLVDSVENGTLLYTHVREASARIKNDDELLRILEKTQDNDWRIRRMMEEIAIKRLKVAQEDREYKNAPVDTSWEENQPERKPRPITAVSDDDPYAGVPASPKVENLELKRLVRSFQDVCILLGTREPDEELIEQVRSMKASLESLEKYLVSASPNLEGGTGEAVAE